MVKNNIIKSQNGFTLLELVISLTIIGVMTVIIYNGLRLGIRARETGENFEENNQRLRTIYSMISSQLKSARPYFYSEREGTDSGLEGPKPSMEEPKPSEETPKPAVGAPKKEKLAFVGKPDSIQFITSTPRLMPGKRPEGIHEATIFMEGDRGVLGSRGLLLRESPVRYPDIFKGEEEPVVLAEDVTDLHFRYYFMLEGANKNAGDDAAAVEEDDLEEEKGIWTDTYDEEFLEEFETSLHEESGGEEKMKNFKSSRRLPLAVEVSFAISVPNRNSENDSSDEETPVKKLVFPPTIVFINSGLKGMPIYERPSEDEEKPLEKK